MAVRITEDELGTLIWRVDALPDDRAENVIGFYQPRMRRIGPRVAYSGPNVSAFVFELALVLAERILNSDNGYAWVPDDVIDELRVSIRVIGTPAIAQDARGTVHYWPGVQVRSR